MFARRKPRPQNEEPLVPHGLIWQATEETMPPSNASQSESAPSPDKTVEMPKFWRKPPEADPSVRRAPTSVPAENGRQSHPRSQAGMAETPRPLAPVQELTKRRMLIEEERSQRKPSPPAHSSTEPLKPLVNSGEMHATASSASRDETQETTKSWVVLPPKTPDAGSVSMPITEIASPVDTTAKASSQPATRLISAWLQKRLETTWGGIIIGTGRLAASLRKVAKARARAIVSVAARLRDHVRAAYDKQSLTEKIHLVRRSVDLRAPQEKAEAIELSRPKKWSDLKIKYQSAVTAVRDRWNVLISSFTDAARRLSGRRIRVRIVAVSPLAKVGSLLRQADAAVVNTVRKNVRLATSMTMAAFSALLTLGMVFLVRNYEPTHRVSTGAVNAANTSETVQHGVATKPQTHVPTVAPAKPTAADITSQVTSKPAPVVENAAIRKPIHRRARRSEDDDYVARDTYVYYGNR